MDDCALQDTALSRSNDVPLHKSSCARRVTEPGKLILFGSLSGALAMCIEYPFDTIKVRLQTQNNLRGPIDALKAASNSPEGFLCSLYRGISVPMLGATVETASLFFCYRLLHSALVEPTVLANPRGHRQHGSEVGLSTESIWPKVLCGGIAGAFTSMLLTPIELIKCQLQVPFPTTRFKSSRSTLGKAKPPLSPPSSLPPSPPSPPELGQIISHVLRSHSISALWRGQAGTLVRETGGSAAWFGVYEGMKDLHLQPESSGQRIRQQISAGALAGVAYHTICFPADTVKSRMQTEKMQLVSRRSSFSQIVCEVWGQGGLRSFYRGYGVTLLRSAPGSAVIFTSYEVLTAWFE